MHRTILALVVLSAPLATDLVVAIESVGGTASTSADADRSAGEDLVDPALLPGPVTVPAGTTSVEVQLTGFFDDTVEGDEFIDLLVGIDAVDSFVFNPHKWLFAPMDLTVFYCRRPEKLRQALSLVPDYLRSQQVPRALNYMEYALPLGRRFRALKRI